MPKTEDPKTSRPAEFEQASKPHRDHANDPLHGITLKEIMTQLEANYGWQELAIRIPINCFINNPSIKSSLTFLRKTPWARDKVEQLYIKASKNWGKVNSKK